MHVAWWWYFDWIPWMMAAGVLWMRLRYWRDRSRRAETRIELQQEMITGLSGMQDDLLAELRKIAGPAGNT